MQIKKIFNNNSVLVQTKTGKEAVVFGKGVGFKQGKDRQIDTKKIQKIFYVASKNDKKSYYYLFQNIPPEIVSIVFDIVNYAKKQYEFQTYDSIYLTLSEHINGAYKLFIEGKYHKSEIPNFKQKYPIEYQISAKALQIINKKLQVNFPESEINSIALHFINSRIPKGVNQFSIAGKEIFDTSKLINLVMNILDDNGVFQNAKNRNGFRRFTIHLQYLAERMNHPLERRDSIDKNIKADMIKTYPRSFMITRKIFEVLKKEYNYEPSTAEETYFIIHIHQIISQ